MAKKSDDAARGDKDKLSLNAAWSMAVGGMIGGGIFATLGVVFTVAGQLAWLSFVIGGAIALLTAFSYAKLTLHHKESGGVYLYLREEGHIPAARVAVWALLIGYTLTVAVYAYTFGAYLAEALDLGGWVRPGAALAIIAVLCGVNLRGVSESAGLEILVVWAKLVILLVLAVIGLIHWAPAQLQPSPGLASGDSGLLGAIVGAASVFMAYEGFQLLSYDYEEMRDPDRNVRHGMIWGVIGVVAIYVMVTLGVAMLVGADEIIRDGEVSLAVAGRAAAGEAGFVAVTVAAVFSTASAINATVFSAARLAHRAGKHRALPGVFARTIGNNVPWAAIVLISGVAALLALFGGLDPLVKAASFVFLAVFATVNFFAARLDDGKSWVGWLGFAGAIAATLVLLLHMLGVL